MRCALITFLTLFLINILIKNCVAENTGNNVYVAGFLNYLNSLPDQPWVYEDGILVNSEKTDGPENEYRIEVSLKVSDVWNPQKFKLLKCWVTVEDNDLNGVIVKEGTHKCYEDLAKKRPETEDVATATEAVDETNSYTIQEDQPLKLDNEVQSDTAASSGEQFIAIRRDTPVKPCVGCASHVDITAAGVDELVAIAIKHLDRHDPNSKHQLNEVLDVERQVQTVNGVRFILTLQVDYNNCTTTPTESCSGTVTCKISILEKPWLKLPNGAKFRAIIANNCTEEWLFGDNGEVVATSEKPANENDDIDVSPIVDFNMQQSTTETNDIGGISENDIIKSIKQDDLQSVQVKEKPFSEEQLKELQEQIIPDKEVIETTTVEAETNTEARKSDIVKEQVQTVQVTNAETKPQQTYKNENDIDNQYVKPAQLTEDKKHAIDELLGYFDKSGIDVNTDRNVEDPGRLKRSYGDELRIITLAEKYKNLKTKLSNAKYIFSLGQTLVSYLNEMDLSIKTRQLDEIIEAEDEIDNNKHYFYIQIRLKIPCEKAVCELKDTKVKICSSVIDSTDKTGPQILNHICHDEDKSVTLNREGIMPIPPNDPILKKLIRESILKIEKETSKNALQLKKILNANVQKISGVATRISVELGTTNCTKDVPFVLRNVCVLNETLGSQVCDIFIHEKEWLKDKEIRYSCIDRPIDETFAYKFLGEASEEVKDSTIKALVQEALQHLELQSNENSKLKLIKITSATTQVIAGLLTNIQFIVGHTNCPNDIAVNDETCELLQDKPQRVCNVEVWNRPWLEEGKQLNVSCKEMNTTEYEVKLLSRSKRQVNKKEWVAAINRSKKENEQLVGAPIAQDVNNPQYLKLAKESMEKFLSSKGITDRHKVLEVTHVTTQVVAGTNTRINFTITPETGSGEKYNCYSEVWEKSWENFKEITVQCERADSNKRSNRQVAGGISEQDPKELKYLSLAEESMQKYLSSEGITDKHKVLEVTHATTQVVAGSKTSINFTITPETGSGEKYDCYSEVWEKSWEHFKEITVQCKRADSNKRSKRQVAGGISEQDPNEPKYLSLAEESMQKYLSSEGITDKHKVLEVTHVTTQVVAGINTRINFIITPETGSGERYDCYSEVWEKSWMNFKQITVQCNRHSNERIKRQIKGGQKVQDPSNPEYLSLAEESMQKYLSSAGITNKHKVLQVTHVTTQVVAGTNTRINFTITPETGSGEKYDCYSEIWEKPWVNFKEIVVQCNRADSNERVKRQALGGESIQDPNGQEYRKLAEESMEKYLSSEGITEKHKVLDVTHVTTQVVAGTNTRINFTITPETGSGEKYDCYSVVWEKSWENFKEIKVQCNRADGNRRSKRQVFGGISEQDPKEQKYLSLAEESMQKYLSSEGITDKHKVLEVTHVTTQVVAGIKTRINFTITPETGCEERYDCYSEVWEKSWMNFKQITVQCNRHSNERIKRQIKGGQKVQDPTNPEYLSLAEESMQKYLSSAGITNKHKVLQVTHVTTQVVAGTNTRINFTITPETGSGEKYNCYSEIWEKPWVNFKEIVVQCNRADSNERVKRQALGGESIQDPNGQEYRKLAEESMEKYLSSEGITEKHKVLDVTHVTTQVVAGTNTRINFTITPGTGSGEKYDCYSEIWEKSWVNFKNIKVQCNRADNNKRSKRQVPGGLSNQNSKNHDYLSLAEESMQKYLSSEGITNEHRVLEVTNVATQVVAGSLTHIDFVIVPEDSVSPSPIYCYSKVWEKKWLNWKNIDVQCNHDKNTLHRSKRHLKLYTSNVETIEDKHDFKYYSLAELSLKKYIDSTKSLNEYYVSKIIQVTTKALAGKLTRIDFIISLFPTGTSKMLCQSMVYEASELNSSNIDVNCTSLKHEWNVDENNLISYLDELEQEQDTHDETYRVLAKQSLEIFKNQKNSDKKYELSEIERVTTRKDDIGTLIKINFKILPSVCSSDKTECDNLNIDVLDCVSLVRVKSTTNIEVSCGKPRSAIKLNSPGAIETIDTKNEMARKFAKESLNQYFTNSDVNIYFKILSIDRVTVQNEEAITTRIDFTISPTNCLMKNKTSSKCIFRDENIKIKCHSDVTERPWLTIDKDIDILCENVTDINKSLAEDKEKTLITDNKNEKSSKSKVVDKDVNAPEYQLLAFESIQRYQHQTTSKYTYKLNNIYQVTSEVDDEGTTTKIDFGVSPTECLVEEMDGLDKCKLQSPTKTLVCHSIIRQTAWAGPRDKDVEIICAEQSSIPEFAKHLGSPDMAAIEEQHAQNEYYLGLAEEAVKEYQVSKKSKYAFKIMRVDHVTRQKVNGVIYRIEFVASPSKCLIEDIPDSIARDCELQEPKVEFNCYAKVWIDSESTMKHKIDTKCAVVKQDTSYVRSKRQAALDDDEIDEDIKYYYADLAMNNINKFLDTKNLQKLISIHNVQTGTQMGTTIVKMYLESASTYCLKKDEGIDPIQCEEIEGINHRLCFARFWPSPEDELIVRNVHVVCDDDDNFDKLTGISITELIKASISEIEKSKQIKYKLVHQGEPNVIPSLDSSVPIKLSFVVASTNCTKDVNLDIYRFDCYILPKKPSRACHSFIWLKPGGKGIRFIKASCKTGGGNRKKRSIQMDPQNATAEEKTIQRMVADSLDKLEMASLHKFKQRLIQINSYSTKLTTGRITTIDFDVGYTACLKYEWVANITSCEFLEHLPRRHCVSTVRQRLWIDNGWMIEVECEDDETPLEAHVEFESAETAKLLANEALKHIEAKYPHPRKQKVVRIFSLEKQEVAGMHYRMKIEVGFTDCSALSVQDKCNLVNNAGLNKFCRVNIWIRPWTDHPPNFRVTCDYQEGATADMYHVIQAEHLFYDFLATHRPAYMNDHREMKRRFEIFKSNIEKIHEFNVRERGTARYAVTRFADLSYEEFSSKYLGLKPKLKDPNQIPFRQAEIPKEDLPPTFDWRTKGAVTEVKNQGSCGSCWAFSVTGNIEGQWKIHTGKLVSLSEQELVDCDKLDNGCNGGLPDNAYRAIEQLGGLEAESDYPYEGADDKCVYNKTLSKVQISGAVNISSNETDMAKWLVKNGPISIGINANAMQFYVGGVSHPWKLLCNPTNLDHGVLIVGYGTKDYPLFNKKLPYWIIKNSWGEYWGEQGYYRVYRGDGTCGVNQMASSAVIDD